MAKEAETAKAPAVDLDAMTVPELRALAQAAEAKAAEKVDAAKEAVLSETRGKLAELGIDLDALLKAKPKAGKKIRRIEPKTLPVKFRGPKGEEWSGRGKTPAWMADAEKQGRKREEFLVHQAA